MAVRRGQGTVKARNKNIFLVW